MLTITRKFEFCAANRIYNPDWSDEKNAEIFGPCANPNGQGHNFSLEVTVSGPVSPATGMIINLRDLKDIVTEQIVSDLDHKHLNFDVPWLADKIPTTENLINGIWQRLEPALRDRGAQLEGLRLSETTNNYATLVRTR